MTWRSISRMENTTSLISKELKSKKIKFNIVFTSLKKTQNLFEKDGIIEGCDFRRWGYTRSLENYFKMQSIKSYDIFDSYSRQTFIGL